MVYVNQAQLHIFVEDRLYIESRPLLIFFTALKENLHERNKECATEVMEIV
jgi:hypothetical protein